MLPATQAKRTLESGGLLLLLLMLGLGVPQGASGQSGTEYLPKLPTPATYMFTTVSTQTDSSTVIDSVPKSFGEIPRFGSAYCGYLPAPPSAQDVFTILNGRSKAEGFSYTEDVPTGNATPPLITTLKCSVSGTTISWSSSVHWSGSCGTACSASQSNDASFNYEIVSGIETVSEHYFATSTYESYYGRTVTATSESTGTGTAKWSQTITGSGCGDSNRDSLIQQYIDFRGGLGVQGPKGKFVPTCSDITKGAASRLYTFTRLNTSNHSLPRVALLKDSLLNGEGVYCYHWPGLADGCGLDTWVRNYGAPPATVKSGFRPPQDQQRVYDDLNKFLPADKQLKMPPGGRHMFGDAVDLPLQPANIANWNKLVNAAINAGADFTENTNRGYPCEPKKLLCVHADWRHASSGYAP